MNRFARVLRVDWPRLVVELFIVVAGITISFAVDEWRRDREDRRVERRIWMAIREDLEADSSYLARRIAQLGQMTRSYDGLLGAAPPDSIDVYMDRAISYVVFTPTQGAHHELRQMAGSRLIRNRALLAELTRVYTREYVRAAEWDGIGRDFILDRMIPYLDATAPYVDGVVGGETLTGMSAIYGSVAKRDHFRNLIRTNRTFKDAQLSTYQAALKRAIELRASIERELGGGADVAAPEKATDSGK